MSTAKTQCSFCSEELIIPAHEVLLTVHTHQKWRDTWRFTCPRCHQENVKAADQTVIAMLVSIAVRMERVHIPAEVEEPHHGPAITWDDVLDFTQALATCDNLERRLHS